MKKQYIFLIMIAIILYIFYLIINFTYKEYKINSHIEYITKLNKDIKENIKKADSTIKYKKSKAYKNKILKQQQSLKNLWEIVIYLTSEQKYNKFTQKVQETSKKAFVEINESGEAQSQRNYILFTIKASEDAGMCISQIAFLLRIQKSSVSARVNELSAEGKIINSGKKVYKKSILFSTTAI